MSKVLDCGVGKHAEGGVAWHFICSPYFFNFPLVPSSWAIACCGLPNIMEVAPFRGQSVANFYHNR